MKKKVKICNSFKMSPLNCKVVTTLTMAPLLLVHMLATTIRRITNLHKIMQLKHIMKTTMRCRAMPVLINRLRLEKKMAALDDFIKTEKIE